MDTDIQDEVYKDIYPKFFKPGEVNLLGVEDAGTYTDETRDFQLKRAQYCPSVNSLVHPIEKDEYRTKPFVAKIRCSYSSLVDESAGAFFNRERLLLNKWNAENAGRIVLPFLESFETEQERAQVEKDYESNVFVMKVMKQGSYWRGFAERVREHNAKLNAKSKERDPNWIRILGQVPEIFKVSSGVKCRVLLTIGAMHKDLTGMVADRLGDVFSVTDEHFLLGSSDMAGQDLCQCKMAEGIEVSDEEVIKGVFHDMILRNVVYWDRQDESAYNVIGPGIQERLKKAVSETSIEDLCKMMGFSIDESGLSLDESLKVTQYDVNKKVRDHTRANGAGDAQMFNNFIESLEPEGSVIDRSSHPNNVFLDKQFVLFTIAGDFGITDEKDRMIELLWQAIGTMHKSDPSLVGDLRRELVEMFGGRNRVTKKYAMLMSKLAKDTPGSGRFYKDRSNGFKTSKRLIAAANRQFGR